MQFDRLKPLAATGFHHCRRRRGCGWPLVARAQQPTMPVIGFMSARSPEDSEHLLAAFRRGLGESGFIEGRNVAVEYRWARGDYARLPALVAELVNRRAKPPQEPSVAPSS